MRACFPTSALPVVLNEFVTEAAGALQCDVCFVALPALSALASVVGNARSVHIRTGWTEPAIIWTGLIGAPGSGKSPAIRIATKPLLEFESNKRRKRQAVQEPARVHAYVLKFEDLLSAENVRAAPQCHSETWSGKFVTNDTTLFTLGRMLEANPRGLLLCRDELGGWVDGLSRRIGSDFWLSAHDGGPMILDRSTGPSISVRRAAVSICGGFQPPILHRTLIDTKHSESGLTARFLFAIPEKRPVLWTDRFIRPELEARYAELFLRLLDLEGMQTPDDPYEPLPLRLDQDARNQFAAFFDQMGEEQTKLNDDLAATWPKLRGYAARLALIIELVSWAASSKRYPPDLVSGYSMSSAVSLVRWFAEQARAVYARLGTNTEAVSADRTLQIVRRHGGAITANELRRADRKISDEAHATALLRRLVELQFGKWENVPSGPNGGRPTMRFVLFDDETTLVPDNLGVS